MTGHRREGRVPGAVSKPSPETPSRSVSRMIAEIGPVEYMGDPGTSARRKRAVESMLLTEDERRARDAAEEADLRGQAEDDRAEVTIKGT